jgi:hypothetical protein
MLQVGETHEQYMARMHDWATSSGAVVASVAEIVDAPVETIVVDETDTTFLPPQ